MQKIKTLLILTLFSLLTFTACKKADPCENTLCLNDAVCEDGSCKCATGYEGTTCNTEMRSKFMGIWDLKSKCEDDEPELYTAAITTGSSVQDIILSVEGIIMHGTISGSIVTIESHIVIDDLTASGTGIINEDNTIVLDLNFLDGTSPFSCQWKLTK